MNVAFAYAVHRTAYSIEVRDPFWSRAPFAAAATLETMEREAILRALPESNWVLGGPHGAASRLERSTLQSRIQKLGIDRSTA